MTGAVLDAAGLAGVGLILADGPAPALAAAARRTPRPAAGPAPLDAAAGATDEPEPTGCAGVALTTAGAGRVATVAPPLDAQYGRWGLVDHRRLLGELLRWCAGTDDGVAAWPVETAAPATVEVTLARHGRQRIVHFVNATGPTPLQEVIPVNAGVTQVALAPRERCRGRGA